MKRYCGRHFTSEEITQIRCLIEEDPSRSRVELSRLTCRMFDWYKADGGLKDMSCRVAMLRMHRDGLIQLPPPRCMKPVCKIVPGPRTDPQFPITAPVHQLSCIWLKSVCSAEESRLWNEYIERYHYLGFTLVPGARRRYFVLSGDRIVALLSFSASAWCVAPRDRFIGWSDQQRKRNLHLIVNNARFLILPWVKSKGLASKTLAMAARNYPLSIEKDKRKVPQLPFPLLLCRHHANKGTVLIIFDNTTSY